MRQTAHVIMSAALAVAAHIRVPSWTRMEALRRQDLNRDSRRRRLGY